MPDRNRVQSRRRRDLEEVWLATGELDLATIPELDQRLGELLHRANFHRLVLDLTGLRFMGAGGLHCLTRAQHRAARARVRFSVVTGAGAATRVLELSAVPGAIDMAATVDGACGPVPTTAAA